MYYDGEINGTPYVVYEGINYCVTKSKDSYPDVTQYPFQVEISLNPDDLKQVTSNLTNAKGEYCIGMAASGFDNEEDLKTFVLTINKKPHKMQKLGKFTRVY